MAQIIFPQREARVTRGRAGGHKAGQIFGAAVGGVAGALTGGPVGAVTGASSGASIGGQIGSAIKPDVQGSVQQPGQQRGIQQASTGAVERRLQEIEKNPHFQLQQAQAALPQLSPEIQKQYAPTIEAALQASRRAQKVGMV